MSRKSRRRNASKSETSNTWWLFVNLYIFYFLYRWNLIYSVTTTPPCHDLSAYWLSDGAYFPNIYSLFTFIFILFFAWSILEMASAVISNKEDKLVAVTVNLVILTFLGYLFYGLYKQLMYFEIQKDSQTYGKIYTNHQEVSKGLPDEKHCK